MSGEEFDTAALVRILGSTELAIVNAALEELGIGVGLQMEAAVSVLAELDDEIRLLRRYRVAQENSLETLFSLLESVRVDLVEIIRLWAGITLGRVENIEEGIALVRGLVRKVTQMNAASQANAKAARLARAKLDDLIETRGKISLILLE